MPLNSTNLTMLYDLPVPQSKFIKASVSWISIKRPFPGVYVAVSWSKKNPKQPQILLQVGTSVHEMLHAIGLMHEQSRSDRDDYIRMIKENLKDNINDGNLAKSSTFDHNPYDYESIMQYGLKVIIVNLITIMIIILVIYIIIFFLIHTLSHQEILKQIKLSPLFKIVSIM
jgi:hypothetical protein